MNQLKETIKELRRADFGGPEIAAALFLLKLSFKEVVDILVIEGYKITPQNSNYDSSHFHCLVSNQAHENAGTGDFLVEGGEIIKPSLSKCFHDTLASLQGVYELVDPGSVDEEEGLDA
jgi:hypothetical protein